ncbi:immunoglobulin-like domain-containing protein [Paenibacillus periandrae]|uniref:immunoglobulin-like domain-containing protein n=1 Tax=Paenibacillus periandrae TaxID=1761741 RepID=UPI001F09A6C4|nr:immunoglobulin-like domain-containing protein [Paenibacillus periandrae]
MKLKRLAMMISVLSIGASLSACGEVGKLEKLGYPEAEITKIIDQNYVKSIVNNKIQYNDYNDIKKHRTYKEDNLEGYTTVLNKLYTKDELELGMIGINALKENDPDYDKILNKKNEEMVSAIQKSLTPKIKLNNSELNATPTDKGTDYIKTTLSAQSYFDGDIAKNAVIEGSFNSSKLGDYTLVVKAKDSKGYQVEQPVKLKVIDNEKPQIKLPAANSVFVGDTLDLMKDIAGTDNVDGDLTKSITMDKGNFTTDKEGTYTITYKLKDSSNNEASVSREVKVVPIYKINDSFELNKYKLTPKSFVYNRTDTEQAKYFYQYYNAKDGNTFLIMSLTIENQDNIRRTPFDIFGNDEQKLTAMLIFDGNYEYKETPHLLDNNWYHTFSSIDPLVTSTKNLTFELPESVKESDKSLVLKISKYKAPDTAVYIRIR